MESGRPTWLRFEVMKPIRVCKGRKHHRGQGRWEMEEDQAMERATLQSRRARGGGKLVRCVDVCC